MSLPDEGTSAGASVRGEAAAVPRHRLLYWSLRRELWENRSLWMAPLVVAALFLSGFLIRLARLPEDMRKLPALDPRQQQNLLEQPYNTIAMMMLVTVFVIGLFYCLDALYGERRDRSILFWKSLPVSDLVTVLSKAAVPLLVLPLVAFAAIVAVQAAMLLLSGAVLLGHGISAAPLWTHLSIISRSLCLFYGLVTLALWHAPLYAWLLLLSAWARRSTFLWAVLPPLALCLAEQVAFGSHRFASFLEYRVAGGVTLAFDFGAQDDASPLTGLSPLRFLQSPNLWGGLAFAAACLAAAVRLRHRREPI